MAKFVFRLQPVLKLKIQLEDQMKNELGKSIRKLEDEKRILRLIDNEKEKNIHMFNSVSMQGIAAGKLRDYSTYISLLQDRMKKQKENVNQAQKNVDKNREKLVKAVQERKMMEKLKEYKYQDFLTEQQKEEQKLNDQFTSFKFKEVKSDF